ncbi:site-specific DNA-methyltransferase [Zooshikella marina]|uniref:site-specific DNA-methyltransferase n=1 Tax=Zooshikella ganghwensis TaxID=202772 RepID=UPI001BAFDBA0|nr:site-specific DNA-methyltransferase [Zooshikella ganghwensis]MBU2708643.1 site-specific DNA-methyltransferase [Zooshikella ganghwensis]
MTSKPKQKLELNWIGKEKRPRLEPRILMEVKELSYRSEAAEQLADDLFADEIDAPKAFDDNILIQGDNLLALKALEQKYAGQVKLVYIDPPYNTGSAFDHYDDGLEHSMWLSLIAERLKLLWTLLHPTEGTLWVSIDDREMAYLKIVLDEICGRDCFIASNIWQKRYSRENREAIGDSHEYILVYAKNAAAFKQIRNPLPLGDKQLKLFKNPDNDPSGPWQSVSLTAQGYRPNQMYEIVAPNGKKHRPPEGSCWKIIEANYFKELEEGRIYFGKDGNGVPRRKNYLKDAKGLIPWTWWPHEDVGHSDEAKKEQHSLFGKDRAFDTPKPERLIKQIIHIASNPGDLILDSFAGSGTTGAVAHKMGRRWILIELGDHCETHIVPRLKKVIDGEDQGGISKSVNWQGGGGFRYFRLAPSLLKKDNWGNWIINKEYNAEMLSEAMCKHMGFTYAPSQKHFWMHGYSTETDFIYVTTGSLSQDQLKVISDEVGKDRSLVICCKAFMADAEQFPNLTLKKIPQAILHKCEWDHDDYSFSLNVLPDEDEEQDDVDLDEDESEEAPESEKRSTELSEE